jgi:hypothetical protein
MTRLPVPVPIGTPLTPPRPCPACRGRHPVGTTCAGGWAPWDGKPVSVDGVDTSDTIATPGR